MFLNKVLLLISFVLLANAACSIYPASEDCEKTVCDYTSDKTTDSALDVSEWPFPGEISEFARQSKTMFTIGEGDETVTFYVCSKS